jgi:hypothetical protein
MGVLPLVTALLPVIGKVVGLPFGDLAIHRLVEEPP